MKHRHVYEREFGGVLEIIIMDMLPRAIEPKKKLARRRQWKLRAPLPSIFENPNIINHFQPIICVCHNRHVINIEKMV